ncbi:hypothetical protein HU200_057526 [Digitaria exilis]|uniref:HSF-type DNA-binding domain-containing protein n=1 Tax=Digitaria exilis TaxID=1010633 RepID=A0A835AFE1_9POAL|nr:hypothetical protein HU200_057526 [Digitaria exilis]
MGGPADASELSAAPSRTFAATSPRAPAIKLRPAANHQSPPRRGSFQNRLEGFGADAGVRGGNSGRDGGRISWRGRPRVLAYWSFRSRRALSSRRHAAPPASTNWKSYSRSRGLSDPTQLSLKGAGFRKVYPDRWEFANEGFLRGQRDLLKTIKRRRPPSSPSAQQGQAQATATAPAACLEVGQFGREGEVDRLQRDKGILLAEVVKLRQEQQATRAQMQAMEERITTAEQKQQQMTVFLGARHEEPGLPPDARGPAGATPEGARGRALEETPPANRLLSLGLEEKRREGGGGEGEVAGADVDSDVDDDVDVLVQSIYHLNPNPGSPSASGK